MSGQLLTVRPMRLRASRDAQIVTLDRGENDSITLKFISLGRANGAQEVRLDAELADQLLTMLSRELEPADQEW